MVPFKARGWGSTLGQRLPQKQAVGDGGGLGISKVGRSAGVKQEPGVERPSHWLLCGLEPRASHLWASASCRIQ